jgi:hypothetical protein
MPDINFILRSVYNFDLYPVALLGSGYKNATIMAIMDMATANQYIDAQAQHVQVYPTLPAGTPNDPNGYDYVKILTQTGETIVLGMAWINAATVTLVQSNTIRAVIGNVSAADVPRIKNALVQNGYNDVTLTIE